ncbi:FAD-dependent oxidoreductase [Streptomyces zagrosensis]|uniref:NADPH-dependent 2,4-dienoyl-CoA reductase/sulfur reductase-like enzyme n=1 Tax=Streptomyces zagrosensis TaxID=1042984 RepID=A0A7W9QAG0_9ACTN|nr:FAD-dependent oxidoreductase [Streptomyces zagrosensis]MBB5936163.1 NADPH-dependent 2,4-dienoyl-CoA reductase/sulfur reductase-like enzyme [Streptomyces zagrosensis]
MTGRQVAVVGAGPAGLAAARAALGAGAEVTLIDAARQLGGQYHRTPPEEYAASRPEALQHGWPAFAKLRRELLGHPRCAWWPETSVWALERRDPGQQGPPRVHLLRGPADGSHRVRQILEPDALVLACGAHDRVLPFPGWELPGVFTAGAAQTLAKGERLMVGEQVVVAGSGPFLLPVAASLVEAGSRVLAVLEANPAAVLARGWSRKPWQLAAQLGKAGELIDFTGQLVRGRVPFRTGRTVIEARGAGRVEEVVTARLRPDWSVVRGSERTLAVDAVCVSHGFSPQLELPVAAGCALRGTPGAQFVQTDARQRTTADGVWAAGEITGIAGAPAARAEGAVAGWYAGGGSPAARALPALRRSRDQGRDFAARLARAHPIGAAWPGWLGPRTLVCRCEETDYATLCRAVQEQPGAAARTAKLATRAGLGPCQARVCGPTVTELAARLRGAAPDAVPADGLPAAGPHHRPFAQPIRLGELARPPEPPDAAPEHHGA